MFSSVVVWGEHFRVNALSQPLTWEMVIAAVPKSEEVSTLATASRYDLTPTFIFLLVILLIWSIFIAFAKLIRVKWNPFGILLCILGYRLRTRSSLKERVVFITMSLLSIILSNELLSLITQLAFTEEVKPVSDYAHLVKFNVSLYSHHDGYLIFSSAPRSIRLTLKDHTILVEEVEINDCLNELVLNNDRICVADVTIINNFQSRAKKRIRTSDFYLMTDFDAIIFAESSPYLDKFNEIMLRSFETGHLRLDVLKVQLGWNNFEYSTDEMKVDRIVLAIMTCVILIPGLGFAMIVFLYEITGSWWRRTGKKHVCACFHGLLRILSRKKVAPQKDKKKVRFDDKIDVLPTLNIEGDEDDSVEDSREIP